MTQITGSPGEYLLTALNDETGWLPIFDSTQDVGVTIRGTFSGTVTLYTSDQADATKTRTTIVQTYTAPTIFALPRELGGWFSLKMTSYVSGTAEIGIGAPVGAAGTPVRLRPQMTSNVPVGDLFT